MTTSLSALRALHLALESGLAGEPLRELFTPDATTTEYPNRLNPAGGSFDLARILAGSEAGAALLSQQRFDVHSTLESGSIVVARLTWNATIAHDRGPFTAGQQLTAHIAQFVEVEEGRIKSIATYDCYEPF